jgi:hypothetical protein
VQVEYTQKTWNFMTSNFRDRNEGLISGYLYYRFLPKTSAFVEYDHKSVEYTQQGSLLLNNTMDTVPRPCLGHHRAVEGNDQGWTRIKGFQGPVG